MIAGAYWDHKAPELFTQEDLEKSKSSIQVIADITCDIKGSIPTTIRPTTIASPIYDIDPKTMEEHPFKSNNSDISVMAVDNLPCELPKDASISFGDQLSKNVIPHFLREDDGRIMNAAITDNNGSLTENFKYLQEWVNS